MNFKLNNSNVFAENNSVGGFMRKDVFLSQISSLSPERFEKLRTLLSSLSSPYNLSFRPQYTPNDNGDIIYFVKPRKWCNFHLVRYAPHIDGLDILILKRAIIDFNLSLEGLIEEARKG